jgi:hypothetical protein
MSLDQFDASYDVVKKPKHYCYTINGQEIQVKDIREAILDRVDKEKYSFNDIDDWSRAWEYLTRCFEKNGIEDVKKSVWYIQRWVAREEGGE